MEAFEVRLRSDVGSNYIVGMVLKGAETSDAESVPVPATAVLMPVQPQAVAVCLWRKAILTNVLRFLSSFKFTPKSKVRTKTACFSEPLIPT